MKCSDCRKVEALDSRWDRFKRWTMFKLFPQEIIDFQQEKYTQGFGDGYKRGFSHGNEIKPPMTAMDLVDMYDQRKDAEPVKLMKHLPSKKELKKQPKKNDKKPKKKN